MISEDSKDEILEQIRLARDLFNQHKVLEEFKETNAWYYLGVFDALVGLYYGEEDAGFPAQVDDEPLTSYLERVLEEFFNKI
jgi:hypothetical protein